MATKRYENTSEVPIDERLRENLMKLLREDVEFQSDTGGSQHDSSSPWMHSVRTALFEKLMKLLREDSELPRGTSSQEYNTVLDPRNIKLYEKAVKEGIEEDRTIRVMMIGCYGQGKTTLVRRMLGESYEHLSSTDGIEVHRCVSIESESSVDWRRGNILNDEDAIKRLAQIAASTSLSEETATKIEKDTLSDEDTSSAPSSDEDTTLPTRKAKLIEFGEEMNRIRYLAPEDDKPRQINLWDFGGQFIYYTTHQLFHSRNAVYLLVFNLSMPLDEEVKDEDFPGKPNCKTMRDYIIFWMQSIHAFVGSSDGTEPVVILVGTHRDKLQNDQEADDYFASVRDLFGFSQLRYHIHEKSFALSLNEKEDDKIQELKRTILDVEKERNASIKVPAKWILLENELKVHTERNVISFDNLSEVDRKLKIPIANDGQLKLFLEYHHNKGNYFFFDEGDMSKYIVLNPQFVIDAFRCIIKSKQFCQIKDVYLVPLWRELSEKAILKPELYKRVWAQAKFQQFEHVLVFVLQKHRIIAEVRRYINESGIERLEPQGFYIVPSLLRGSDNKMLEKFLTGKHYWTVGLVFSFDYVKIVGTVFQKLLSAAIGTWPIRRYKENLMVFSNAGVFELDLGHAGLIVLENENIEIYVVSLCEDVSEEMGDYLRRFSEFVIQDEFRKLKSTSVENQASTSYELKIRCRHAEHGSTGSVNVLQLKKVQEHVRKTVGCPDGLTHSLGKKQVQAEWFGEKRLDFPVRELTLKEYNKLSMAIGRKWKDLGGLLKVSDVQLQHIEMNNPRAIDKIYQMLLTWRDKAATAATFNVLVDALRQLPKNSVDWDRVHNVKDGFC